MKGRRRARSREAFTLIEIIAALAIIGLGLVGILSLFPVGIDASKRAGDLTQATALGQSVIEQIRSAAKKGDMTLNDAKYVFETSGQADFRDFDGKVSDNIIPIVDDQYSHIPKVGESTLYQYQVTFEYPTGRSWEDDTGEPFKDLLDVGLRKVTVIVSWPANEEDIAFRNRATFVTFIKFPETR